ncbi:hypothetical protein JANAI62_12340 [Jannaschia pagri]|uniref:Rod shape-determining protein MreD n=1 Tax=Jannaschia pagri TaxID=2829797 RepID=A0ABQ4NJL1_9RHOB|nr:MULTISPECIES: rod shape-determining protein MreD [unclassified Jannaschia]GIT90779.1 hypothetical protein JANAI61_12370 [Jannaschia sp. AI_61]GIT94611.1 hypothetical protein JANAI62_12340 [Jannaschia sp. AI_62]
MALRTIWTYRLLFVVISFVLLFFALLPFSTGEGRLPAPDLMMCLVFAWILRRPDYVPLWLLVPLLLLDDALLMRPLGVWTLVVMLASEYLRRRVDHTQAQTFWSEMVLVSGLIAGTFLANHVVLLLLLAETAPILGQVLHATATIVFYPLTVLFSQLVGVRRLAPGELDSLGTRA